MSRQEGVSLNQQERNIYAFEYNHRPKPRSIVGTDVTRNVFVVARSEEIDNVVRERRDPAQRTSTVLRSWELKQKTSRLAVSGF